MTERQFTTPLVIRGIETISLQRIPLLQKEFHEGWLEQILFDHPSLLPIRDIDPVFAEAVPVVRELPTRAGRIDLVYINPNPA